MRTLGMQAVARLSACEDELHALKLSHDDLIYRAKLATYGTIESYQAAPITVVRFATHASARAAARAFADLTHIVGGLTMIAPLTPTNHPASSST